MRRRAWMAWVLTSVAVISLPMFTLAVFDKFWPLREGTSFLVSVVVILVSLVFVLRRFVKFRRQLPDEKRVALMLEKAFPELMDSLICSLELLQQQSVKLNPFNKSLLHATDMDLRKRDIRSVIRLTSVNMVKVTVLFLLAILLILGTFVLPLVTKTFAYTKDLLEGETTALIVTPGDIEIGEGDDLTIEAQILRGPENAMITLSNREGEITYDMYRTADGVSTFEVFSVDSDFSYTISTPIVKSRQYHVRTYQKPSIVACRVEVTPPEYTQLPRVTIDELKDFSVPQGSQVAFSIKTNLPVKGEFETTDERVLDFQNTGSQQYLCEFQVKSSTGFVINLEDDKGHLVSTNRRYNIESVADFPPLIQIISPEENAVRKEDGEVSFSFRITDDYGLKTVRLFLSISGTELRQHVLYQHNSDKDILKEKLIAHSLQLKDVVKNGDVIAYYCTVKDNALPKANVGRSDVRFIEIRPDKPDPDEQKPMAGGKIKKLKVSDLIVEQKHLIRTTWDLERLDPASGREELIQELAKAASDLRIVSSRRLAELKGITEPSSSEDQEIERPLQSSPTSEDRTSSSEAPDGGLIGELFRQAIKTNVQHKASAGESLGIIGVLFEQAILNMERAENILKKQLAPESLPFQQQSLSKLVALEIELEKNTPPSGEGEEGEEGSQSERQGVTEKNESKSKQEFMALLESMVANLEELIQKQTNLNDELSRNIDNTDDDYRRFLKKRQEDIHQGVEKLRSQLQKVVQAESASQELSKAGRSMEQTIMHLNNRQPGNAIKTGKLAHQFLQRGKELLEDLRENLAGDQLQNANAMLQDIKRRQKELANATKKRADGGAQQPPGTSQDLVNAQKRIRENFDEFLKNVNEIARDMESGGNPGVVKELSKALKMAAGDNISGKMKRSENAIRYNRHARALDFQQQSNASLSTLSDLLQNAMNQAPSPSNEQLASMLQKVMTDANRLRKDLENNTSAEVMKDLYSAINQNMMGITKRLNDARMDDLALSMADQVLGQSGTSENMGEEVLDILYRTAHLLESKLMESTLKKRINLTRITGQEPPDEYKKLVNEYFKNLSTVN